MTATTKLGMMATDSVIKLGSHAFIFKLRNPCNDNDAPQLDDIIKKNVMEMRSAKIIFFSLLGRNIS